MCTLCFSGVIVRFFVGGARAPRVVVVVVVGGGVVEVVRAV